MSIRLLIVDDEPFICDLLEQFLRKKGFEVRRANDGIAALEIVQDDPIDVVVSDIKMPGISGVELLQKIRGLNKAIPVLKQAFQPGTVQVCEQKRGVLA